MSFNWRSNRVDWYCLTWNTHQRGPSNFPQMVLAKGFIRPGKNPWSSTRVMGQEKDGTTQFCRDFWQLSESTVGDSFPIPRIDDSLNALGGAKLFTTLDFAMGYGKDCAKTAFSCYQGLFEFNTMPTVCWNLSSWIKIGNLEVNLYNIVVNGMELDNSVIIHIAEMYPTEGQRVSVRLLNVNIYLGV